MFALQPMLNGFLLTEILAPGYALRTGAILSSTGVPEQLSRISMLHSSESWGINETSVAFSNAFRLYVGIVMHSFASFTLATVLSVACRLGPRKSTQVVVYILGTL